MDMAQRIIIMYRTLMIKHGIFKQQEIWTVIYILLKNLNINHIIKIQTRIISKNSVKVGEWIWFLTNKRNDWNVLDNYRGDNERINENKLQNTDTHTILPGVNMNYIRSIFIKKFKT